MNTRTAGALIGILLVVCFGLVLSAMYPFTTSEPHAANPPDERFTVDPVEAYSTTESMVVDGEVRLAVEGVVTSDGAWYQKVVWEEVTSEKYRPTANGTVYQRLTIEGRDRAERRLRIIGEDEDSALVRQDRDGDHVTFVVEKNTTGATESITGMASRFVRSLSIAGYETDETDESGGTIYEPRAGWYEKGETALITRAYRITGASGEIRVDAETHAVKSANVSWDVTTPAGTYAEYVLARLTSDDPTTHRITFERNPDDDLDRPPWVDETDSE